MPDTPSPNGANRGRKGKPRPTPRAADSAGSTKKPQPAAGRAAGGRFAPGNPGGPGNPYAKAIGQLRSALLAAVTPDVIHAIIACLVEEAKRGNVAAAREVLDRCLGRPVEADLLIRLEALEETMERSAKQSMEPSRELP
jgi:hypothetical protein